MTKDLEVSITEAAAAWQAGSVLVDVREPYEYEAVHISGSQHIPLGEITLRVDELDATKQILVLCAVGGRSLVAAEALCKLGFNAVSVAGGITEWIEEGRAVAR